MGSGKSLSTSEITTSDTCSPANAAHRISRTKKLTRSERSQKPNVSPTASSKTKWQKWPRNKLEAVAPLKNACTICSKCLARSATSSSCDTSWSACEPKRSSKSTSSATAPPVPDSHPRSAAARSKERFTVDENGSRQKPTPRQERGSTRMAQCNRKILRTCAHKVLDKWTTIIEELH